MVLLCEIQWSDARANRCHPSPWSYAPRTHSFGPLKPGGSLMKITHIVDLHADAGWRVFSFLKIQTDAGIVGWSEYNESYGSKGLTGVILKLAETLIGQDPRPVERIAADLYAKTRQAPGGLIQQAIAAIENALIDVKAKALGVPVCEMLGGPVRNQLRLYWSHCGTYRLHHAKEMGLPPVRNLDDICKLGEHVRERGFTALKTNIFLFDGAGPELYMPGFLESYAMDVGIVDLPWNGILESMKIAAMAEAYEVNCAPHNFYGHMSTLMSAHFCAAIPNFRIMEIDIDDVPWKDDLVTEPPRIENGHLIVPSKPGWGADINEAAVRKHAPK